MALIGEMKKIKISFNNKEKEYWIDSNYPDELIEDLIERFGKSFISRDIYRSVDDYEFVWCILVNIV